jgi:hypothetical protein
MALYSEMSIADLRKERTARNGKIKRAHARICELEAKIDREMAMVRFIKAELKQRADGR